MKPKKLKNLTLCDSYQHSPVTSMNSAKHIFRKIVQVYDNREDVHDCYKSKNMFQALQQIGGETMLIVVHLDSQWWTPWKGSVTEDVYYYKEEGSSASAM
ncbi:hypothetical protein [Paenibacillus sp. 1001270B_150601_E10]|uniref:hypothetical protein n=1 Tax=Paenibacillus sp. 1001270B_150601_E10 TaxID=2787079 RepID=UPI0018A106E9|nr:hypothetical protein [Paenibacillus sp. 1001270B_150601_E10]